MPADPEKAEGIRQIRRLRLAAFVEATTLALLVFVAVPLKHVFGLRQATAIIGPVHGLAFLFYLWAVMQAAGSGGWPKAMIARMVVFAFIPLAGFINERLLWQQQQRLSI